MTQNEYNDIFVKVVSYAISRGVSYSIIDDFAHEVIIICLEKYNTVNAKLAIGVAKFEIKKNSLFQKKYRYEFTRDSKPISDNECNDDIAPME